MMLVALALYWDHGIGIVFVPQSDQNALETTRVINKQKNKNKKTTAAPHLHPLSSLKTYK